MLLIQKSPPRAYRKEKDHKKKKITKIIKKN